MTPAEMTDEQLRDELNKHALSDEGRDGGEPPTRAYLDRYHSLTYEMYRRFKKMCELLDVGRTIPGQVVGFELKRYEEDSAALVQISLPTYLSYGIKAMAECKLTFTQTK